MPSSKVAVLAVLALAGSAFAAPMNGNDVLVQRQATGKINATVTSFPTSTKISLQTGISKSNVTTTVPTSTKKATLPTVSVIPIIAAAVTTPTEFKGPGDEASGWPSVDKWVEFEKLWNANKDSIGESCTAPIPKNSAEETQFIHDGILSESKASGVDARYILAVIMQESHGCVRVGATASPGDKINNPGIMQSHNGENHCVDVGSGPCSQEKIVGMIHDGTSGTKEGDGLKQGIDKAKKDLGSKSDSQSDFISARLYNSGINSYKTGSDLAVNTKEEPAATPSYSSDIANRVIGVVF